MAIDRHDVITFTLSFKSMENILAKSAPPGGGEKIQHAKKQGRNKVLQKKKIALFGPLLHSVVPFLTIFVILEQEFQNFF